VRSRSPRRLDRRVRLWQAQLARRRQQLEAEGNLSLGPDVGPSGAVAPVDDQAAVSGPPSPLEVDHPVPRGVRAAADWSWRFLVIAAAVALVGWLAWEFKTVIFPVIAAVLIAAGLGPLVRRLRMAGWSRGWSGVTVFLTFLVIVVGTLTLVGNAVGDQFGAVVDQAEEGLQDVQDWLAGPPLSLDEAQLNDWLERLGGLIQDNEAAVTEGAAAAAGVAFEIVLGVILTLFALVFFLYDGDRIWAWLVHLLPRRSRSRASGAGDVAWRTLAQYVRGTLLVALFDAVGVVILLLILRVPLAVPLAVLVFFGAFVPLVGAFVTGALAVLVASVTQGLLSAVIVLLGLVAIQQLEGHVFQPLILGRMVRIHPLAVVIAVTVGSLAGGIIGAVIAVPIVAVANTAGKYLAATELPEPPPESGSPPSPPRPR
jgi:predicted PurR-regulated permease PerM